MHVLKKTLKLLVLVLLIVLALLGIGIGGGVPISSANKKEDNIETKIELLDSKEDKSDTEVLEAKFS